MCVSRKFKGLNFKASKFLHRSIAPKVVVVLVDGYDSETEKSKHFNWNEFLNIQIINTQRQRTLAKVTSRNEQQSTIQNVRCMGEGASN